ncbi:MAG: glycosyl transferase family 1 [Thalassobius sp.]|nr:glycosyl transferase family 1 [Thalassovita sp.]
MKYIVITSLQSWYIDVGSNCKDIALELSKKNRVIFVNRAYDRITNIRILLNKLDKKAGRGSLEQINPNLWVYTPKVIFESVNWINNSTLYDFIGNVKGKKWSDEVLRVTKKLGFDDPTFIIDNDFLRGPFYAKYFKCKSLIYYLRDNLLSQPYFYKHGKRLEKRLMKSADFVFANSTYLCEYAKKDNPESYYIGQGFDKTYFSNIEKSEGLLSGISKPIIGYVGNLTSIRIDVALLEYLASNNKEWNFVFVGPEDEVFKKSDLHSLSNVFFIGKVTPDKVPFYIKEFSVCINPQLLNEMTIGNYPRKIDEYLSVGEPVVALKTPGMEPFAEHVYLAENFTDFAVMIKKALEENSTELAEKRRKFAEEHTWENSVNKIFQTLGKNKKELMPSDFVYTKNTVEN